MQATQGQRSRSSFMSRLDDRGIATLLALMAIAVRLPFRAEFLVNWDAVNFALGINSFDLATHQPHPPGYLGWVVIGRVATWITSDPNAAMTLLSAAAGAIATALVYFLARRFVDRRAATVVALLFSTAPLIWYYSVVALSYMTTGAVALALLLALLKAVQDRSGRALLVASALLPLIGAMRPTDQAMLFPAWAVVVCSFGWSTRLRATALMGTLSLLWVGPLLWISGGPGAFAGQGSAVADLAGSRTWVFGGNLAGIGQNLGMVASGLVLGLFGGLVVLLLARSTGIRPFAGLPTDERRLLATWVAPPLAVYLLLHTGQLGYVILLLPVFYVGVARALPLVPDALRDSAATRRRSRVTGWLRRPTAPIVAMLVVNTVAFLLLPAAGLRVLELSTAAAAPSDEETPSHPASLDRTRQYDVAANDQHWRAVVGLIDRFDPRTTAVVTETSSGGSFRHLSYYAKDHNLYGFGWDRRGDLGFLFHALDRKTTYSVEKLSYASEAALLPTDVRTLIVPDGMLIERWEDTPFAELDTMELADGTTVAIVRLSAPGAIAVDNPATEIGDGLTDGFPSAADRKAADEEAEIRVVAASDVSEPHPAPESGVLD